MRTRYAYLKRNPRRSLRHPRPSDHARAGPTARALAVVPRLLFPLLITLAMTGVTVDGPARVPLLGAPTLVRSASVLVCIFLRSVGSSPRFRSE